MTSALSVLRQAFHKTVEFARDVYTGIHEKRAMPARERKMDALECASAGGLIVTGVATLDPLVVAGAIAPAAHGLSELQHAGHKWRQKHPPKPAQGTPTL